MKGVSSGKLLLGLLVFSISFLVVIYTSQRIGTPSNEHSNHNGAHTAAHTTHSSDHTHHNDTHDPKNKWIILVTSRSPTRQVEALCSMAGWKTLVVASTDAPVAWSSRSCMLLSVEMQYELTYEFLPPSDRDWDDDMRKLAGYMYAIERGADVIMEVDDDSEMLFYPPPLYPEILSSAIQLTHTYDTDGASAHHGGGDVQQKTYPVANPYTYFGQGHVWPRGFPVNLVKFASTYGLEDSGKEVHVPVHVSLINLDPDVDTIFRITHADEIGKITFKKEAPPLALPRGVFVPWGARSVAFYKTAFWGMWMPRSIPKSARDIWRSLWCQRLLWIRNHQLLYTHPFFQSTPENISLSDGIKEEMLVYTSSEQLINFLASWNPKKLYNHKQPQSFPEIIKELTKAMVKAGYLHEEDVLMQENWLKALQSVGYEYD